MHGKYFLILLLIACMTTSCFRRDEGAAPVDFYASELFHDVQMNRVFPDSKTFVDCTPKRALSDIMADYTAKKDEADFDLKKFVSDNFLLPDRPQSNFHSDSLMPMQEHITKLWPVLTRSADVFDPNSSRIPLPGQYIVPGGRFSEIYYWDSYFTMLGLQVQGRYDLIRDMVSNFGFLIDSIGFIPNGNRNYYLSRSQPPFYSMMVKLLEKHDANAPLTYLPMLQKEYEFWMRGSNQLKKPGDVAQHVVSMPNGTVLNRYYDRKPEPRPEAFIEDVHVAKESGRDTQEVYTHIRSAAESGWDFSSRWFADGKNLTSINTTDIIPVDLNCLMYHLEVMIGKGLLLKGDNAEAERFAKLADARKRAILTFCWDADQKFFFDYDYKLNKRTAHKSLAGIFPLFFEIAAQDIAEDVAGVIEKDFLKPGGVVTTLSQTGQQWDSPNGWAPLQWVTYQGLKNYNQLRLATEVRKRWIRQNMRVYAATGKMMEKYNVMDTTLVAGGGEYPNQDGFGWTNGVALALVNEIKLDKQ